jgi:hypothetical protein
MKIKYALGIVLALFLFVSASPWEGAAVAAPDGELPGRGFFIATNSFPRNTVVDITNLETGRSTRVIVSGSLNRPGLLAAVSREAADLIGIRPGSVSRIRMTQPSEPIAYTRFMESMRSGTPDFDSGNLITEENFQEEENFRETVRPAVPPVREPVRENQVIAEVLPAETNRIQPRREETTAANNHNLPGYVIDQEWLRAGSPRNIVDLPPLNEPVEIVSIDPPHEHELAEAVPEETIQVPEQIAEIAPPEEQYLDELDYFDFFIPQETAEEIPIEEEPMEIAELDELEYDYIAAEEEIPSIVGIAEFVLVPAEEHPPQGFDGIDPSMVISGIIATEEPPLELFPFIEPILVTEPVAEPVVERIAADFIFSVPRIFHLDRGKFYVQLAAFDTEESVENAVRSIDRNYKPVVYKDGDHWYRVLLGPLNQGESAAVLQRFRSIGYRDAFVRRGTN